MSITLDMQIETTNVPTEALKKVINYMFNDEMKHFCEIFEIEPPSSNDSYQTWIQVCEARPVMKEHIFYQLLLLCERIEDFNLEE